MVNIIKASGEISAFDPNKLRRSLERVRAESSLVDKIVSQISNSVVEGMTTRQIYRMAFSLLKAQSQTLGARYHLKRAIMDLGSSGYPFEKYVAELLNNAGYQAQLNKMMNGYCVQHEVDVYAQKANKIYIVECKYHNRQGLKCDVKIPLYFNSRVDDLKKKEQQHSKDISGMLITNTRFTTDAEKYGTCVGLRLVGWDFPQKGNLKELIEMSGLYPITCIKNFTKSEIHALLNDKIVLCRQLKTNVKMLRQLRIPDKRLQAILKQCEELHQSL